MTTMSDIVDLLPCTGPLEWGDQGILYCPDCGECECCKDETWDARHVGVETSCFLDPDDACHLKAHAGRACQNNETT